MIFSAIALSLSLAAQAPAQGQPSKTVTPNTDKELICRKTTVAGSKFKKRMCATQAEWDELARRSSEITRELQQNDGSTKGG